MGLRNVQLRFLGGCQCPRSIRASRRQGKWVPFDFCLAFATETEARLTMRRYWSRCRELVRVDGVHSLRFRLGSRRFVVEKRESGTECIVVVPFRATSGRRNYRTFR